MTVLYPNPCYNEECQKGTAMYLCITVLDLGLISIASLGPRASTKVESHANFTESQKVSQHNFFLQY